jgi:3-oxoadipate enol-lactonase
MTYLPVNLAYEEHGQGTPVILAHGFPLNRSIWYPILPLLTGKARLILPDLRGHGQSPVPDGIYSMRLMAEDLRALMDRLNIEKAILAGHSMGGYVSLAFARAYPTRLAGLALVSTQAMADSPERRAGRQKMINDVRRKGVKAVAEAMAPALTCQVQMVESVHKMIMLMNPKGVTSSLKGMAQRPNAQEWLSTIKVPTVVIAGVEDRIIPIERPKVMTQLLGRAWLVEVNGAGHLPMMEQPGTVSDALLQLINSI